jgi:hypothetical protein
MNSTDRQDLRERALALHSRFFAIPNRCDPSAIAAAPDDQRSLLASLHRFASGATDRGVLLPFRLSESGPTSWFALAASSQMLRALQEELRAFIGSSYVSERLQGRAPDAADEHALPLIVGSGWYAARFDSVNDRADAMVLKMWRIYNDLLERRPRTPAYVPSTFHQLRASFDRALLARDEAGAQAALASLRERFGVSAENRQFLEIRLNVAFERWEVVAANPLLPQLIHLQLPPETYGDIMEALYRARVQQFESKGTLEAVLERFQEEIAENAQPLFTTKRTSRRPAVIKAFLLHELLQLEPQAAVCERLLNALPLGAFGAADGAVRQQCKMAAAGQGIEPAREALRAEQFDRAWELFWGLDDSSEVLRGLIACAREVEDPAKTSAVLTRLEAVNEAIRRDVESLSAARLAKLRASFQAPIQSTQLSVQLERWPDESADRYVDRWAEFARSVDPGVLLAQVDLVEAACDRLMRLSLEDPALFERAYPSWHELFIERADPSPQWVPLYVEMLEVLRVRDVFQRADQELIHQLLVTIVDSGDVSAYRQSVDTVTQIFTDIRSPRALCWALDVCDSLFQRRVRDADARMRLLTQVVQACHEFKARLDPMQLQQLRLLVEEAKLPPLLLASPLPEGVGEVYPAGEATYRIVLYSLNESATRRAVEILRSLHPNWVINTNADHVCSDRLKSLAQHADVFVFAWRCSKHAAYHCVKASSRKQNLVMARGVGTSSLVEAAVGFLQ